MTKLIKILPILFLLVGCRAGLTEVGSGMIVITKETSEGGASKVFEDQKLSRGLKTGMSCVENFMGLVAVGDASIEEAKRDGRIREVVSFDKNITAANFQIILPFLAWGKSCTIVRGY